MRSFQDLTFSTRIQYGIPRDSQRDENWKCLTGKKTLSSFYWNPWGLFRTSLFPPGSSMGSQGTAKVQKTEIAWQVKKTLSSFYWNSWSPFRTSLFPPGSSMGYQGTAKGTKTENVWQVRKNLIKFLLKFMRSSQDLTFSTRIQYGIPRDNQMDENWKCLTGKKTLSSFYWNSWGPFRTSLFPPGSIMGSQGTAKGTKTENVWQVKKPYQVFIEVHEVPSGPHFFHQDPVWDPKGQPEGRKLKMSDR